MELLLYVSMFLIYTLHTAATVCLDDETVDCARLDRIFSICTIREQGKHLCPQYCKLCDVVDGEWSIWTVWSHCDVTCNHGTHTRTRSCTNPQPAHGGLDCVGSKIGTRPCYTTTVCPEYSDCSEIKAHDIYAQDGVYDILLWNSHRAIKVYCDMTTDGGGWTVFQNRYDGSVDFYRNYTQYVNGFGNLNTEFWLGLDYLQEMTSQHANELRIDLMGADGTTAFETLSHFSLSLPNYKLHVGNTTSANNIGSSNRFGPDVDGQAFSTYDHDIDSNPVSNCASLWHGAWWYNNCYQANLNGQYFTPGVNDDRGINYLSFIYFKTLKQSRMAFRRT